MAEADDPASDAVLDLKMNGAHSGLYLLRQAARTGPSEMKGCPDRVIGALPTARPKPSSVGLHLPVQARVPDGRARCANFPGTVNLDTLVSGEPMSGWTCAWQGNTSNACAGEHRSKRKYLRAPAPRR